MVVESASLPSERRILTTLGGLGAAAEGLDGPALLIIGEVVALATERPLAELLRPAPAEARS